LPTEPKSAQADLNRRIRPGETARHRYIMGEVANQPQSQRTQV
jgi:hypothetical protein